MHDHSQHQQSDKNEGTSWLKCAAIGTALVGGAIVLSPYILPVVGIGESALAEEAMLAMHGTGAGNGLAGTINGFLGNIPYVGSTLAGGGLITAATSATIGIGGSLLGKYIDKKDDGTSKIRWGRVIATAALATSALIALPSLLTSLSVGAVYIAAAFAGVETASAVVSAMASSLGSVSALSSGMTGVAGAAVALPHMLTCVTPAIPGIISLGMLGGENKEPITTHVQNTMPAYDPSKAGDDRITVEMEPLPELKQGQNTRIRLHLTHTDTGKPVTPEEIQPEHGENIHLFVADQSLRDYHHIHPQPTNEPGVYETEFTPKTSYHYNGWSDIKLKDDQVSRRIKTTMTGQVDRGTSAYVVPSSHVVHDGIDATFKAHPPLQKGVTSTVEVTLNDTNGKPITDLEPVIGAFIHMVGIGKDSNSFMHMHPDGEHHHLSADDRGGPTFTYTITPDNAGPMQFYLQVQRDGKESFIPMGQVVKSPSLLTEKMLQPRNENVSAGYYTGV